MSLELCVLLFCCFTWASRCVLSLGDACYTNRCANGACIAVTSTNYTCSCNFGYTGRLCDIKNSFLDISSSSLNKDLLFPDNWTSNIDGDILYGDPDSSYVEGSGFVSGYTFLGLVIVVKFVLITCCLIRKNLKNTYRSQILLNGNPQTLQFTNPVASRPHPFPASTDSHSNPKPTDQPGSLPV